MDEELERKLIEKYPFTRAKQDPQELTDNMEIMAKQMTKDDIENVEQIEDAVGKKGLISDTIKKEINKNDPKIYEKKIKPIWDLMVFGFDVDNGWYGILDKAFSAIQKHLIENPGMEFKLEQVKEKYGTLRIYCYGGDEYIDGVVTKAEKESEHTCEICGKKGKLCSTGFDIKHKDDGFYIKPNGGWYKMLCEDDAKKLGYIYKQRKISDEEAYKHLKKMKTTYSEMLVGSEDYDPNFIKSTKKDLERINKLLSFLE